jgi:hypothetical protein
MKHCSDCAFCSAPWTDTFGNELARCHRYPPQQKIPNADSYPIVTSSDWCGEFKSNDDWELFDNLRK